MKIGLIGRCCAVLAALVWGVAPAAAQLPRNISDLEQHGMVFMDDITTPLLHHVMTGAPYRREIIASDVHNTENEEREVTTLRRKAASSNEFIREEVRVQWQNYLDEQIASLKQARGYLIPLQVSWNQYDFASAQYRIAVHMLTGSLRRGGPSYHCAGGFTVAADRDHMTACLYAVNEAQRDPFLTQFPVERDLARRLREQGNSFQLMALVQVAGAYKVLRGNELRYVGTYTATVAGFQPVSISHLVLLDRSNGNILAISRRAGSPPGFWESPAPVAPAQTSIAASQWRMVAQSADTSLYADPSSVRRDHSLVMLRTLHNLNAPLENGVQSVVRWYENDCAKRTQRQVKSTSFAGQLGAGAPLEILSDALPSYVPEKGSMAESMFNFACNARVSSS